MLRRLRFRARNILWLAPLLTILVLCFGSYFRTTTVVIGWQDSVGPDGWSPLRGVLFVHGAVVPFTGFRQGSSEGPVVTAGPNGVQGSRWVHLAHYGEPQWRKTGRVAPTFGMTIGGREAGLTWAVSLPSAYVAAAAVAIAVGFAMVVAAVRRAFRQRRARMGLCEVCGYDLRGSPERCPECGSAEAL